MEEIPLLAEAFYVLALAIGVLFMCHRLHLPAVVGFLLTGILCGPFGFGIIHKVEDVQTFASIGIVLLLFTVGMEVSIKQILSLKRFFLLGGALQIVFTLALGAFLGFVCGRCFSEGLFWGCLLALSSTAIVLRMLAQQGEIDTPHGRAILAILIFQDFCAVPMMLVVPFFGGGTISLEWGLFVSALKGISLIAFTFTAAWLLVPKLLYYVARTRMRELFLIAIICICLVVAWVSAEAGLSLALGAFLAGLVISQSDFSYEAIGNIAPFQDLFTSFFFISIGMLLDVNFVWQHPLSILSITLVVLVFKAFSTTLAALFVGMPLRTASLVGLGLAQISEFSFVLAKEGVHYGVMPSYEYQLFLSVALLSMAVTPWIIGHAHMLAGWIDALPMPMRYKKGFVKTTAASEQKLCGHVVIIGFGLTGRSLANSCRSASIQYTILEMNAETVRKERKRGEPIHYGDASHEAILEHLHVHEARAVAIVINDAAAAMRIIVQVKKLNPDVYLVVRTRYVQDVERLYALGVNDVIPDEYGAAIEVFTRVLRSYDVSKERIQELVTGSLIEGYELLRMSYQPTAVGAEVHLLADSLALKTIRVTAEAEILGQPLSEWPALAQAGVSVVALARGGKAVTEIDASMPLEVEDHLVVVGPADALRALVL
jgi:CPA2 family monovalent cation:H+ antiporter-2